MKGLVLVTGGAGFIGGHLTLRLLSKGAHVRVIDDFSTGSLANLATAAQHGGNLEIRRGDVRDLPTVERAAAGVSVIFHQAALRSIPLSVADPLGVNETNVTGTLNVFEAARRAGVPRVVYASSSSVYGRETELARHETEAPAPISPYATSKAVVEQYGRVWYRLYRLETVGLRYFNAFGPRQDAASEYAAVIPRFIMSGLTGAAVDVHGDGSQSRDFTYVDNIVDANLLAARVPDIGGEVFNVGCGHHISLLEILACLEKILGRRLSRHHTPRRPGDVQHARADISKSHRMLGYVPRVDFDEGLARTIDYFRST